MEKENIGKEKRRRWEKEEAGEKPEAARASGRNKRISTRGRAEEEDEEEVEEFFAIVRRMQVAVKYFDRGNIKGHGWRAAVESIAGDEGQLEEKVGARSGIERDLIAAEEEDEEGERGVFDLNVAPPVKG